MWQDFNDTFINNLQKITQVYNDFGATKGKTDFKYIRYPDKNLILTFLLLCIVFEISQG